MRFLTLLSISSAVALVAAECCGSGGNCNGYGPCNIFCCNCDWRYRIDLRPGAGRVCRKYVCIVGDGGDPCAPPGKLKRSAEVAEIVSGDRAMLQEASGGNATMSLDNFIEHSQTLGVTDVGILTAKFKEHDLNGDGVISVEEMRLQSLA